MSDRSLDFIFLKSNLHIYIILITIIDEGDAVVPSLPHYDDVTEHATEKMLFVFGTSKIIKFQHNSLLLSGTVECYYFI